MLLKRNKRKKGRRSEKEREKIPCPNIDAMESDHYRSGTLVFYSRLHRVCFVFYRLTTTNAHTQNTHTHKIPTPFSTEKICGNEK